METFFDNAQFVIGILTDPKALVLVFLASVMGLIFGSLPGLTATMGIALLVPLTFTLNPLYAISMMLGVYVGGIAGGMVSATLINIPGTPSSVVTTLDGYPMTMKGEGAQALGWGVFASFIGGFISWAILVVVAPRIARFALRFGSPEYAMLTLFGITIISTVSGKSILKGIIAGLIGVWLSLIGVDPIMGNLRFTFGRLDLMSGISIMPALIGFYSFPQLLTSLESMIPKPKSADLTIKNIFPSVKKIWQSKYNLIRSSIIGTFVGMVPATGGNIASFIAYDAAKRFSKDPDSYGKGNHNGIIASEAANNGVTGGALTPLLTLGIPGDSPTAVLLGALLVHGIHPGPKLFTENVDLVYGIFTTLLLANIFIALVQLFGIKVLVRALSAPLRYLIPILLVLSIIGSYSIRNSVFDVFVALALGLIGIFLKKAEFPMAPTVLGLVLGPLFEREISRSFILSNGSMGIFITRPIAAFFLILSALVIITTVISKVYKKEKSPTEVLNNKRSERKYEKPDSKQ